MTLLQRMWQHLTSPISSTVPAMTRASANFASISAGPATDNAPTSSIPNTQGRDFVDQVVYKGCTYRAGDFVHLANPDDATRPIVGMVHRVFIPHGWVICHSSCAD